MQIAETLTGTEKQIAAAQAIRERVLLEMDGFWSKAPSATTEAQLANRDRVVRLCEWIKDQTTAGWWLDTWKRGVSFGPSMFKVLLQESGL